MNSFRILTILCLGAACIAAAFAVAWWLPASDTATPVALSLPQPLPAADVGDSPHPIALRDVHGSVHLLGGPTERPTFVYFWSSWCAPCIKALPEFEASLDQFRESEIDFVSVGHDEASAISGILSRMKVSFRVLVSEGALIDPLFAFGGKDGLVPFSVLLDERGTILLQIEGKVDIPKVIETARARNNVGL
jgi:thiol-disulfide isomerase/thioredoxin